MAETRIALNTPNDAATVLAAIGIDPDTLKIPRHPPSKGDLNRLTKAVAATGARFETTHWRGADRTVLVVDPDTYEKTRAGHARKNPLGLLNQPDRS